MVDLSEAQGNCSRNIHEDSIFYHHEISKLSSRESRKSHRRCVASPALVGVRRVFSAGWHTQALARMICEIREIRVKFNHLCVKTLVRLPYRRHPWILYHIRAEVGICNPLIIAGRRPWYSLAADSVFAVMCNVRFHYPKRLQIPYKKSVAICKAISLICLRGAEIRSIDLPNSKTYKLKN